MHTSESRRKKEVILVHFAYSLMSAVNTDIGYFFCYMLFFAYIVGKYAKCDALVYATKLAPPVCS